MSLPLREEHCQQSNYRNQNEKDKQKSRVLPAMLKKIT
jgi:hypothetical protein